MLELTKSYKLVFTQGHNRVTIQNDSIEIQYAIHIEEKESAFYGNIPAFKIHFYTKSQEQVEDSAQETLTSFFNFWKKTKPLEEFIEKMIDLGFSMNLNIKSPSQTRHLRRIKSTSKTSSINLNKNLTLK